MIFFGLFTASGPLLYVISIEVQVFLITGTRLTFDSKYTAPLNPQVPNCCTQSHGRYLESTSRYVGSVAHESHAP